MKRISLIFEGYFTSESAVPSRSGIYAVYRGTNNTNNTVTLKELVYVGESSNVRDRLSGHEKKPDWERHLLYGETLIYSFAPIVADREQAEAAIINHHKPKENSEYAHSFPFEDTQMNLSGKHKFLDNSFTVRSTGQKSTLLGSSRPSYY